MVLLGEKRMTGVCVCVCVCVCKSPWKQALESISVH